MTRNSFTIKHGDVGATLPVHDETPVREETKPRDEAQVQDEAPAIGNRDRFSNLVAQNLDFVWRTVRRLGVPAADADDATQQVFVVTHQKMAEIRIGSERAFLIAVATRVASRMRRTMRRREQTQQQLSEIPVQNSAFSEHAVNRVEARDLLDRVLDVMPAEVRVVFVLFELEDLSVDKIAELLDLPRGTVATRLRKARTLFAEESAHLQTRRNGGEI